MDRTSEAFNTIAVQSLTGGKPLGNSNANIINNYGVQVPLSVPATFEELVTRAGWRVSPPEIDLDYLCDGYNLPESDTGKWIFGIPEYTKWQESSESALLWLCGGPGTGKTMLAKRVAAELLKGTDNPPRSVKLGFNFILPELPTNKISDDDAELSQHRLAKVARDLLYSILQQDGNLFGGCKAELEKQGDRFFTNQSSLWKVLRKAIQDCQADSVFILIDGVDGLQQGLCKELMGRILELMEIRVLRIFLSSRDVPHVSSNLPANFPECTKISLDTNSFVREDVETFIRRRVNAWGWDVKLREKAIETLLAKSEGTFLWAPFAIENLTHASSGPDFEMILERLPLELEGVYRIMLRTLLSDRKSEEVLNLIRSVALALRPLTFSELGHILACIEEKAGGEPQPSHSGTSSKIRPRTKWEIRNYVQSSLGFLRAADTTVSIVHCTAIKYLFDQERQDGLPVLSKSEADLNISWECFRYLHHAFTDQKESPQEVVRGHHDQPKDSGSKRDHQEEEPGETPWRVSAKWPYLRYAAESWLIHARRSIEISKDKFYDNSARNWLQYQFFDATDVIRKPWIELCRDPEMAILAGEQTQLHIAVCLGLMPLVEKAILDFSIQSPLHLAAKFISEAYKILIDKGGASRLLNQDPNGNIPQQEAAISGPSPIFKVLVKKLAERGTYSNEINKKNGLGNTPLHLALQLNRSEIVVVLVKSGADPTIKNNALMTPLELAVMLGREDSLDILKQAGKILEGTKEVMEEPAEEPMDGPYHGETLPETLPEPPPQTPLPGKTDTASEAFNRIAIQNSTNQNPVGNNSGGSNITNNYGVQVPLSIPATFGELIARAGWRVSPPEIDLGHLCDEYNLPESDTGKWIFGIPEYTKWQESSESALLWLCGGPGTGKTMLAKRVAAELLKGTDDPPESVKLGFNFILPELPINKISDDDAGLSQHRLAKVARDLLYSILQQDGNLFGGCKAELEKQGDRFFTNPVSLWKVLRMTIRDCRTDPVYILIDGLDGLKGRSHRELIGRILGLMEIRNVKIFLSSRDVPHIANNLSSDPSQYTRINLDTNSFVKEDVKAFIRCRVNRWGWDANTKERTETLLAKSEGTFLWASLAIESLTSLSTGPSIEPFLKKLPLKLEDLYRKILRTLLSRVKSGEVLNLIRSVALAFRPLTFCEFGYILTRMKTGPRARQPPNFVTSSDIRPRTEMEIREYVQSSLGFLRATATAVSIVHPTAIEYLFDRNSNGGLLVHSMSEADLTIAWECFRCLHDAFGDPGNFPKGNVSRYHYKSQDSSSMQDGQEAEPRETPWEMARKDPQKATAKWPYLRYAAEFWFHHARRSIEISKDQFYDSPRDWLQYQFFEASDAIRKPWIELCGDPEMEVLAGEQTQVYIALRLGLVPLVEKALSESAQKANSNQSPLHLAAKSMSEEYKILIAEGELSLLTAPDQYGNTPLHEAAISGHLPMLRGLLKKFIEYGVDKSQVNKENHTGNTPLHLAFQFDRPDVVKFLVANGADPTIKNHKNVTAAELGERLGRGDCLDILKRAEGMQKAAAGILDESGIGAVEGAKEGMEAETGNIGVRTRETIELWLLLLLLQLFLLFFTGTLATLHTRPTRRKLGATMP